jgi:hypothetical protein
VEKDHVGTRRINKVSVPDIAVFLCVKVDGLEDLIEELTCPAHEGFALKRDETQAALHMPVPYDCSNETMK